MTTESETPKSNGVPVGEAPAEGVNAQRARPRAREATGLETPPETPLTAVTQRDGRGGWWGRLVDQLTPPEPWTHRPASLRAMARYARRGGWTGPAGTARWAGVWWYRLVAIPVSLLAHYAAWTVARPARTFTVVTVWAVLMKVPALHVLAAAVLPWNPWPMPIP